MIKNTVDSANFSELGFWLRRKASSLELAGLLKESEALEIMELTQKLELLLAKRESNQ